MQKQKKYWVKIISLITTASFVVLISAQNAFSQWNLSNYDNTKLPKAQLATIISNIAYWLLAIFGFVAVISFLISAILYFISAGDEDKQETAKRAMIYSITGVIVGLVGLVVIYAVNYFLGGNALSASAINCLVRFS